MWRISVRKIVPISMAEPFDAKEFREGMLNMEVFCFDHQQLQIEDICEGLKERSDGKLNVIIHVDPKAEPNQRMRDFLTRRLAVSYPYYIIYDEH